MVLGGLQYGGGKAGQLLGFLCQFDDGLAVDLLDFAGGGRIIIVIVRTGVIKAQQGDDKNGKAAFRPRC
jgi:hypothetical protein